MTLGETAAAKSKHRIIYDYFAKIRDFCFLNLRKTSPNPSLKVGDVKPVSTGDFFGNST